MILMLRQQTSFIPYSSFVFSFSIWGSGAQHDYRLARATTSTDEKPL